VECARISISAEHDGAEVLQEGTIVGERGPDLTIEEDSVNPVARAVMLESTVTASLEIDGALYVLETTVSGVPAGAEPGTIHLRKPAEIMRMDRRRSPRRRLREPAEILLRAPAVDESWQCKAAMLNLSLTGVACRVPGVCAAPIYAGLIVQVTLRFGARSDAYELNGQVVNITQGGTPEHLVVGLEFVNDKKLEASRAVIRDALDNATRDSEARQGK
jgi:c-di-GMP-binding flagellar brake protein YcgR